MDDWLNTDTAPNLRGFGGGWSSGGEADFSSGDEKEISPSTPPKCGKGGNSKWGNRDTQAKGGWAADAKWGGASYWDPAGLSVDMRLGLKEIPHGLSVIDGKGSTIDLPDLHFEEQEDSNIAMVLREDMSLRMSLGSAHNLYSWTLGKDGKVHTYTLHMAIKLDKLPRNSIKLFHGRGAAAEGASSGGKGATSAEPLAQGEGAGVGGGGGERQGVGMGAGASALECVHVYKNGGVGALGQVGTAATALKAERWTWVTVTRTDGELKTYVNARLCAEVKLEPIKVVDSAGDEEGNGNEKEKKKKGEGKTRPNDALVIDPVDFAIFLSRAADDEAAEDGTRTGVDPSVPEFVGLDAEQEGLLHVKYVSLVCEVMDQEKIKEAIHGLRATDEFMDAKDEAQEDKWEHLMLHKLYAKPPPVWLHPCFSVQCSSACSFSGSRAL